MGKPKVSLKRDGSSSSSFTRMAPGRLVVVAEALGTGSQGTQKNDLNRGGVHGDKKITPGIIRRGVDSF